MRARFASVCAREGVRPCRCRKRAWWKRCLPQRKRTAYRPPVPAAPRPATTSRAAISSSAWKRTFRGLASPIPSITPPSQPQCHAQGQDDISGLSPRTMYLGAAMFLTGLQLIGCTQPRGQCNAWPPRTLPPGLKETFNSRRAGGWHKPRKLRVAFAALCAPSGRRKCNHARLAIRQHYMLVMPRDFWHARQLAGECSLVR